LRLGLALGVVGAAVLCSACPTVDLGESPPSPGGCRPDFAYYRDQVWPNYLAPADPETSCVRAGGCHDIADGRSTLLLDTAEPVDHEMNYQTATRFLDCYSQNLSPLLTKPLAEEEHGGGVIFAPDSPKVNVLLEWFNR
jgi:hypothetical protein